MKILRRVKHRPGTFMRWPGDGSIIVDRDNRAIFYGNVAYLTFIDDDDILRQYCGIILYDHCGNNVNMYFPYSAWYGTNIYDPSIYGKCIELEKEDVPNLEVCRDLSENTIKCWLPKKIHFKYRLRSFVPNILYKLGL